jgi:hypothetical protein
MGDTIEIGNDDFEAGSTAIDSYVYSISYSHSDSETITIVGEEIIKTTSNLFDFELRETDLPYKVEIVCKAIDSVKADKSVFEKSNIIVIQVNKLVGPTGGVCVVTPLNGVLTKTGFKIETKDWETQFEIKKY